MALASLADYKATAGITSTDATSDTALTQILLQAQAKMERLCGRRAAGFETATWTERVSGDDTSQLRVSQWPITSITSITRYSTDGSTTTVTSTDYRTAPYADNRGWIHLMGETAGRFPVIDDYGFLDPSSYGPIPAWSWGRDNYSIVYVGGYTTVPDDLKAVLYEAVGMMYANRAGVALKSESIAGAGSSYTYTRMTKAEIDGALIEALRPWRGVL